MEQHDPKMEIYDLEANRNRVCLICKEQASQIIDYGASKVTVCDKNSCKFKAIDLVYAAESNWLE